MNNQKSLLKCIPESNIHNSEVVDLVKVHVEKGSIGIGLKKIPGRKTGVLVNRIDPNGVMKDKKSLKLGHVLYKINNGLCYIRDRLQTTKLTRKSFAAERMFESNLTL